MIHAEAVTPVEVIIPPDKVLGSPSYGNIIALRDGRLMWCWANGYQKPPEMAANYSDDGGRTWSDAKPLRYQNGEHVSGALNGNLVRLPSGTLGLAYNHEIIKNRPPGLFGSLDRAAFIVSRDEGETWSDPVPIHPPDRSVMLTNDRAVVLSTGRIIIPVYSGIGPRFYTPDPKNITRHGETFRNGHSYVMWYAYCYYSDDQGLTWRRSENEVYAMIDRGTVASDGMEEPSIVELKDGRLMMFARTRMGCVWRSYSEDGGNIWYEAEPVRELVSVPSSILLKRIPDTGDLLVIWNQVSAWETMTGLYRHRLSCAISKDEGQTWGHFKNLESLDDVTKLEPQPLEHVLLGDLRQPVDRTRYHRAPGMLRSSYPSCAFHAGKAIITYGYSTLGDKGVIEQTYRTTPAEIAAKCGTGPEARANKVRVLPIEWFYAES